MEEISALTKGVITVSIVVALSAIASILFITEQYSQASPRGEVFVMYAGSLVKTFENTLGPSFQSETGYTYIGEGKGSVQLANMIIDQQRRPDIFVSAGTVPIKRLMDNKPALAHWLVKFATAEVVIAYTPNSPFFDDLEKARKGELLWYEVLSEDGLKFRRTDPELDPKGYYTIIVAKLANMHYKDPTIKDRILGADRNPEQILPEETLKTALQQGQIDAAAAYKHEAVARGLPYIILPKEINLSDPSFSNFYKEASYTLGSSVTVYGDIIPFCITIPETSKYLDGAIAFMKFLLSEKGASVLERDGLYPITIEAEGDLEEIPSAIIDIVGD
ncbi:MAG: molybdate/tungstate transport system substrate-binding protein [Candidatus Nitrosomirales archaeon]